MTPNAANGRNDSTPGSEVSQLLHRWVGLVKSLIFVRGRTNIVKKSRLESGQSEIDLSDIMQVPVGHLGVQTTMSDLLGPEMPCPSPYPQPHLVLPAKILEALGTALKPVGSAFSIIMADNLWNNRFAYDHCKKQLIEIDPVAKELTGRSIESIPSQVGDSVSVPPPGGNFYQADLVTGASVLKKKGKRTVRSFRSESVCAKTEYCAIVLETDTHNTVALQAWCNIMCNIPELCFSVVDTGNRSPHWVFIVPRARKKELQRRVGDMMRMLGNDNSGWSNCKITRLGNTGRGIARDDNPAMQTLIWFSAIPSHLNPNRRCQTWNDFEALFQQAVLANKDSIEAECVKMEATIANLRLLTVGDNKQIPPMTTRIASTNRSTATTASTGGSNSPKMELRGLSGGKAFQYVRHALREQLSAAADKLELSPEVHAALASEVAKECDLDLDDAEGIIDKVCAEPHGNYPSGKGSSWRPYKSMGDDEFVGPLNFSYPASFWATDRCRSLFQRTEECYTEFAFTALVLHERCHMSREDVLSWLQAFHASRPSPVYNHFALPGHWAPSPRVIQVTNETLTREQADRLLYHWSRYSDSESDTDELLATMANHLGRAGLKLWEWIEEDLYRLEEKYWDKEKAKCGTFRMARIILAVEGILAKQAGKKKPSLTTEMVLQWLVAHSEHDFQVDSTKAEDGKEAKLASILRGLRILAAMGVLHEVPKRGNRKRKEVIFRRGEILLQGKENQGVTNENRNRYRHTDPCINIDASISNPRNTKTGESKTTINTKNSRDVIAPLDNSQDSEKAQESTNAVPAQKPPNAMEGQKSQIATSPAAESSAHVAVKGKSERNSKTIPSRKIQHQETNSRFNLNSLNDETTNDQKLDQPAIHPLKSESEVEKKKIQKTEKPKLTAEEKQAKREAHAVAKAAKAAEKAKRKADSEQRKADKASKPKFLGVPGLTFRLQISPGDGAVVVGPIARGKDRQEQVGNYARTKVKPLLRYESHDVPVVLESIETFEDGNHEIRCLLELPPEDEKRLLAEGLLKPKNPVVDLSGKHYLRAKFNVPANRVPDDLLGKLKNKTSTSIQILWVQGLHVDPNDSMPFWISKASRIDSMDYPPLATIVAEQRRKAEERARHRHQAQRKSGW